MRFSWMLLFSYYYHYRPKIKSPLSLSERLFVFLNVSLRRSDVPLDSTKVDDCSLCLCILLQQHMTAMVLSTGVQKRIEIVVLLSAPLRGRVAWIEIIVEAGDEATGCIDGANFIRRRG